MHTKEHGEMPYIVLGNAAILKQEKNMLTPKQRVMLTFVIGYSMGSGICQKHDPTKLLQLAQVPDTDSEKETLIDVVNYALEHGICKHSGISKEHFEGIIKALQEPTPPQPPKRTEGWERLPQVRKFHYYVDGRSLCRKYGLLPHEEIQADTGNKEAQKEDCITCFRKLVKRRAEKGVEKIE